MDGRGRAWRQTACVALAIATGCGSSGAISSTDAGDAGADVEASPRVDGALMPADDGDSCPGAHDPHCGVLTITRVADCTYALPNVPPLPTNVAVYKAVDGGLTKIPWDRQDQEGWDYVDATSTSFRLYGSWCDMDRAGTLGTPTFLAGCIPGCIP